MARPIKNSCDYFSHDNDMRNHRKIKSLRNKFGMNGYGIWVMLLEYLTGIDGNEFEYTDFELELIAGDFGVSVTEIREVVSYCILLELLFNNNGFIYSESLNKRLEPVYRKRGIAKKISENRVRKEGKFIKSTEPLGVSVTEKPQSKVKESKVKESIYEFEHFWNDYDKKIDRLKTEKNYSKISDEDRLKIKAHIPKYKISQPDKIYRKDPASYLYNKSWENDVVIENKKGKLQMQQVQEVPSHLKKVLNFE